MKKFVLLFVLASALCCRMLAQGNNDSFFISISENTEYKLYDSYAKSEPDVKSETNSVPIGSGVVLLASLAFCYHLSKVKSLSQSLSQRSESKKKVATK
jgi:hypothetical protein